MIVSFCKDMIMTLLAYQHSFQFHDLVMKVEKETVLERTGLLCGTITIEYTIRTFQDLVTFFLSCEIKTSHLSGI